MKSNYFKNIAGTAIMAFSLILGISSITAAQSRDRYQNDRYRRQQDELRRQQAEQLRRDQQDRRAVTSRISGVAIRIPETAGVAATVTQTGAATTSCARRH